MNNTKTESRVEVLGRISRAPELKRTSQGVAVCRFTVVADGGPATNPVVKPVYVLGDPGAAASEDLAIRCTHLGVGDLVYVPGVERQRVLGRKGGGRCEAAVLATDVRLRARAGGAS